MRRVYSVSRYWPPILSARSSTATSRRSSQHESSWTTRGCRLTSTSSGGPSASPKASALFSQRIVRLYLVSHSGSLTRNTAAHAETAVPQKPENETRALSEPAFADRFVSGGPVPAELHD